MDGTAFPSNESGIQDRKEYIKWEEMKEIRKERNKSGKEREREREREEEVNKKETKVKSMK
jgi:hypothetical protein